MHRDEIVERAKRAWNSIADEFNQWEALSLDERDTYVALSAALSIEQTQPVAVKPLEWQGAVGGNVCLIATANTPFGRYFIESDVEGFALALNQIGLLPHPTFAAAKAAAQQDYETRIKSAIVEVPVVTLSPYEAEKIAKRLEFDASWDKCGDGYYSIKRQLSALSTTRIADSAEAGGSATSTSGGEP